MVSCVEKASLERIRWLLDIIKGEWNHELLLSVKNLHELGANPFPYIVPIIPLPLPAKLIRGKHFVLADLLKSNSGISSQARSTQEQEPQAKLTEEALASFVWLDQSPLAEQDSQPTPQEAKKKKRKKAKKKGWIDQGY